MDEIYKNLKLWLLVLAAVTTSSAFGQTQVSGTVTTEQNTPLPGVSVLVKGTTHGATTDANGQFQIDVTDRTNAVLSFSFIGYANEEVAIGNRTVISIRFNRRYGARQITLFNSTITVFVQFYIGLRHANNQTFIPVH